MKRPDKHTLASESEAAGFRKVPVLKAIRAKWLDCCCGSPAEVSRCHIVKCPLWPYRFGTNPFTARRGAGKEICANLAREITQGADLAWIKVESEAA